jgi:dihydrolipoamide dehydrogenase
MSQWDFDVIVIGAGPGGYVAAIRAAQLGKRVAVVEKEKLGGVCLNKGCIPTKALLKSAHAVHEVATFASLGIDVTLNKTQMPKAVERATAVAGQLSKGVEYLMKKNKIQVIKGEAEFVSKNEIRELTTKKIYTSSNFIIATGAGYKQFPGLVHDNKRIIGAWEAVKLSETPKSIAIIGAGAIGVEFAYFWNAFGVKVHIFERRDHLLPLEDLDSSLEVEKAYKKYGIELSLGLEEVSVKNNGPDVTITLKKPGKTQEHMNFDLCLLAVGMEGYTKGLGLEKLGISVEKSFIKVNSNYQTTTPNIYAIGDVSGPPLLAHAASHEGVIAAEHLSGLHPHALDPLSIPGCTYCQPQVASVGYTEQSLKEKKMFYTVGKLPFSANGKALASLEAEGFIKVLLGKHGELLGAHIVGSCATELIHEYVLMKTTESTADELLASVHPHPTLGEFLSEAVLAAQGRPLNY